MPVVSDASPLISSEVKEIGKRLELHEGEMYALSLALHASVKDFLADDKLARIAARILELRANFYGVIICILLV